MGNDHQLHKRIGEIVENFCKHEKVECVLDEACRKNGEKEQISLFSGEEKDTSTRMCKVDIVVIKNNQVRVIVEIEESDIIPTKIFGKLFTSEFSQTYINKDDKSVGLKDVLFVQIVDRSKLPEKSKKPQQFKIINNNIKGCLEKFKQVKKYEIICGVIKDFKSNNSKALELIGYLEQAIR